MAWSAFAHLYSCSAGFGDNMSSARKLAEAFEASYCSMEVKFGVKEAANLRRRKRHLVCPISRLAERLITVVLGSRPRGLFA